MKTIHPAVAQHAMEESEKLRGLLRRAVCLLEIAYQDMPTIRDINSALSRQAEPDHVEDMRAMVEPAPAQDEREAFDRWFRPEMNLHPETDTTSISAAFLPYRAWKAALRYAATRPAQTEQQPLAYMTHGGRLVAIGDFHSRTPTIGWIKDHEAAKRNGMTPLYAAPIAQTAPVPEQSGYLPLSLTELLQRYKRDLELRTFPDNEEGDYQLRWTAKEIERVNTALSPQRGEA